jgi:hypothetical protein
MTYTCPVCGYDKLLRPPKDYTICKSCGTEFGYDDFATSHPELRRLWIANGMQWHSRRVQPPEGWNPILQLLHAGFGYELGVSGAPTHRKAFTLGGKSPATNYTVASTIDSDERSETSWFAAVAS